VFGREPVEPLGPRVVEGSFGVNYYFDNRDFNTLNIFTTLKNLAGGFTIWGFTDLHSAQNVPNQRSDLTMYFMEYRLIYPVEPGWAMGLKGLAIEGEYNDFSGSGNSLVRVGPTFRHRLQLPWGKQASLQWRYHPYESDGMGFQASVLYGIPISTKLKLTGFADLNAIGDDQYRWVVEPQLVWQTTNILQIKVELRYNPYEDANLNLEGTGVALGFGLTL
jgi:hypothetical protein